MKAVLNCLSALMVVVVTGAFEALPAQATSDVSGRRPRVPVMIALSEALPQEGAGYTIYRNPGQAQRDVILLRADADERVLSEAVRALLAARRYDGDRAVATSMLRARRPLAVREQAPAALPWAARVLRDLRAANPRSIEGVGTVKAVEIWVPRQNGVHPHR